MAELGYQNAEKAVLLLVDFYKQGKEAAQGGFQPIEAFKFIDELARVPGVVNNFKVTLEELKDSSHPERENLDKKVQEALNEEPAKAKLITTRAIDAVISITMFVDACLMPSAGATKPTHAP